MNGINGYQSVFQSLSTGKEPGKAAKADKTQETQTNQKPAALSSKAKKYLNELKKKYGDMDFTVANFSTDEEAQQYMSKGSKRFSVVIEPETLEEMAHNEEARKRYEGILAGAGSQFDKVKEELGEDAENIKSLGISVDKNGIVSYLAEMVIDRTTGGNETGKKEDTDETGKTDKNKAQKDTKGQVRRFKASSIEELLDQIRKAQAEEKSNSVKTDQEKTLGQSLDYKI